jgi:hypothetical protein
MKSQILLVFTLLALCCVSVFGQTSSELQTRYGTPVEETFKVRNVLLMTVKYAADGRACEMVFEGVKRESANSNSALSENLVLELIDEFVPLAERGEKSKFYGLTLWTGQEGQTNYSYENVFIHYFIRQKKLFIEWQNRKCKQK